MDRKIVIIVISVILLAVLSWLAFGYFGIQYLFFDNEVSLNDTVTNFDECVAAGNPTLYTYPAQCVSDDGRTFTQDIEEEIYPPEDTEDAGFGDSSDSEPFEPVNPIGEGEEPPFMFEGSFTQGDSTYSISGDFTIYERNGSNYLRIEEGFRVTNGPDLFVYLVDSVSQDNATVKQSVSDNKFINIATLKGNVGGQEYLIPDDVNIEDFNTVSIWCKRFARNFGHGGY